MAQDLFVKHSAIADKNGLAEAATLDFFGRAFFFSKADELWKKKRKACSHAFYKDRMEHMLEVLKDKIEEDCLQWMAEIEASEEKQTTIDISKVFNRLYSRSIIHICFGEDISDQRLTIAVPKEGRNINQLHDEEITVPEAIVECTEMGIQDIRLKMVNPLFPLLYRTFDYVLNMTSGERNIRKSFKKMRAFIHEYVQKRKQGTVKSTVRESADLLSLFLEAPDIFTDEFIVDELIDFFVAASQTTMHTQQTAFGHYTTTPASREKARAEFDEMVKQLDDPSLEGLSRAELLRKTINIESISDLTFMNQVI